MKKIILWAVLAAAGLGIGSASAETIWKKSATRTYDYTKYGTWIYTDLRVEYGVWPVAFGHTSGSVWTDDGWQTVRWSTGQWVANVSNPYGGQDEAWAVDMLAGGPNGRSMGQAFTPFTVEYALYVKNAAGQWAWDNNGGQNHRFYVQ